MQEVITKEEIVNKLGIDRLEPDQKDDIVAEVIQTIDDRILNRVYGRLEGHDVDELNRLIDQNDEGAVEWYIKSKFDNYDQFARETALEFLDEFAKAIGPVAEQLRNLGNQSE